MIDPGQLAGVLELLAQALRALPPGVIAGQSLAQAEPTKTVGEWLDVHLREMEVGRGYREQTLRNKRSLIAHCRRIWGARPLAELRPPEIVAGGTAVQAARYRRADAAGPQRRRSNCHVRG